MTQVSRQRLKPTDRVVVVHGHLMRGRTGVVRDIRNMGPGQSQALVAWDQDGGVGLIMVARLERASGSSAKD